MDKVEDVPAGPFEDLMREHGVLDRVLLIYEAGMRKFSANEDFDPSVLTKSAEIIRDFIEKYHQKNEETYIFPRFRRAGKMVDLVEILRVQHESGRRLTATILATAPNSRSDEDGRRKLIAGLQAFVQMSRPHAAREESELFPQLKQIVSANEFDSMPEDFKREERRLFGGEGFEKMTQRIAGLEQTVGIHDLQQFTPAA